MGVTFFLADEASLDELERLDPDRDVARFQRGEHGWVLQTYHRLRRAGHPVRLTDIAPGEGLVVFHVKQRRELLRTLPARHGPVLVAVRADNREAPVADFELLQNGRFADDRRRFFVPYWPQPGLVPRDEGRGTAIRRIAFKGYSRNLEPAFRSREWLDFLAGLGIAWDFDAVEFEGATTDGSSLTWHDFSQTDLVLAVRPPARRLHTDKPATKLYNCWHAGVPALLGPEFAYRELRRDELDYIEISGVANAKDAVRRLLDSPTLYHAMVENGRRRAVEFTTEAITARWAALLFETLPALLARPRYRLARNLPRPIRTFARRVARLAMLRPPR